MKLDSIERLQSQAIDYMQKGAAMRLAWAWIAQDHWVRRDYGPVTIKDLSHALKDAHACVWVARHHEKQKALAEKDPRVVALREQRAMLENKSFRTSIREDQRQIDQQINNIIRELETAQ